MLTEKQKHLIEKIGRTHEAEGLSPAVSRVLGLLLVSDKIELTFDEIRNTLNLSKSATSNALNLAMRMERIEYITQPGDRKRYFRSNIQMWQDNMMKDYRKKQCWAKLFREVIELRTHDTKDFNEAIENFVSFIEYLGEELPKLYKHWEEKHR